MNRLEGVPRTRGALVLALAVAALPRAGAAAGNEACALLTAAELQGALGAKVSGLEGGTGSKDAAMCMGSTPTGSVMLRRATRKPGHEGMEAKGIEMAEKMGAKVEVKTFGPITCSTMIPAKSMEAYGFNTTCSVLKGGQVGAVEVTAKSRKDMVPIERLRPLAEKIAGRL
jgi:hypothetical protein